MSQLLKDTILNYLFMVLFGFILINLAINLCLYSFSKIKNIKMLCWYWTSLLLTYLFQGQFQEGQLPIILSFSVNIFPVIIVSKILFDSLQVEFKIYRYIGIWMIGVAAAALLHVQGLGFTASAMPLALSLAVPFFEVGIRALITERKSTTVLQKLLGFFYVIGGIHLINFAIFRMEPDTQIEGWGTALALYQVLSISLFALAFEDYSKQEKNRLQGLVKERTSELNNSLKENESLLKVLLHDVSNPLTVMRWYFQMVKVPDDENGVFVGKLKKSHAALESIVKQVKDLYGQKSIKQKLQPVAMEECFQDVSFIFAQKLTNKNVSLKFKNELSPETRILAERTSFTHSVLSNLISNGIKFSNPNSTIEVTAKEVNQNIILEVRDYGPGISEEVIRNLMQDERLSSTIGTDGELGSGYGLSIVKNFVESYGGGIEIDSRQIFAHNTDHGTNIRITLNKASLQ